MVEVPPALSIATAMAAYQGGTLGSGELLDYILSGDPADWAGIDVLINGWVALTPNQQEVVSHDLVERLDSPLAFQADRAAHLIGRLDIRAGLPRLRAILADTTSVSAEVVFAIGRLNDKESVPTLRQLSRIARWRHASLIAIVWIDPIAALPDVAAAYRDVADLINDASPNRRGDWATHSTFHTLVEVIVSRHGVQYLPTLAQALKGQNPVKDALLADYLASVAEQPLLPTESSPVEVTGVVRAIRRALDAPDSAVTN